MKLKNWQVVVELQYELERPTKFKMGISALTMELAIFEAGQRIGRKFKHSHAVTVYAREVK